MAMLSQRAGLAVPKPSLGDDDPLPESSSNQGSFDHSLATSQARLGSLIEGVLAELKLAHAQELKVARGGAVECFETQGRIDPSLLVRSEPAEPGPPTPTRKSRHLLTVASCSTAVARQSIVGSSFDSLMDSRWSDVHDYHPSSNLKVAEIWTKRRKARASPNKSEERCEIDIFEHANYRGSPVWSARNPSGCRVIVANPSSSFNTVWRLVAILLLSFDILTVPMTVFDYPEDSVFMTTLLCVHVVFWTSDLPLSCFRGYVNQAGDLEMRQKKVLMHYLRTHFLQDIVLLVIEWVNFVTVMRTSETSGLSNSGLFRALKFARLLKIAKASLLLRFLYRWLGTEFVLQMVSVPKVAVCILLAHHFMACGWQWVSGQPGEFWDRYVMALHWSYSQMGFGWSSDQPRTLGEHIYATCSSVLCAIMVTILIGAMVTEMARSQALVKTQRDEEERMHLFMRTRGISWALRNRIWTFLFKAREGGKKYISQNNVELLRTLPGAILLAVEAQIYIPTLTMHPFFNTYAVSGVSSHAMRRLLEEHVVGERSVIVEHELFLPWTRSHHMFFVMSGHLYYRAARGASVSGRNSARGSINYLFQSNGVSPVRKITSAHERTKNNKPPRDDQTISSDGSSAGASLGLFGDHNVCASRVLEVAPDSWLCEAALWLDWHHVGIAAAKTDCELITLEGKKFQEVMHKEMPEAQAYAKLFARYAQEREVLFNDVFLEYDCLQDMAKDVFEPPLFFSSLACRPEAHGDRSEWNPTDRKHWHLVWSSPWKEVHAFNTSALLSSLTKDMKHDIVLLYQTMFARNLRGAGQVQLSHEEVALHDQRVLFMKRLVLCLAICRLRFTPDDNGQTTRMWPYPLASALCHGSRVLVHLSGVSWKSFLNLLMFGSENAWAWEDGKPPAPIYARRAASHAIRLDAESSQLKELKVQGVTALCANHLGMDLPLGGLGNPAPQTHQLSHQLYVGPAGVPFRYGFSKTLLIHGGQKFVKEVQHGHLYMRWDEMGEVTDTSLEVAHDGMGWGGYNHGSDGFAKSRRSRRSRAGGLTRVSSHKTTRGSLFGSQLGDYVWSSNLDCWLPPSVCSGESWTEVPPVDTVEEVEAVLRDQYDDAAATAFHKLWAVDKEVSLERHSEGQLRCRCLLVHLAISRVDGGEERFLVQRSASAQADKSESPDKGVPPPEVWRVNEACKPAFVCPRNWVWKEAVAHYLRSVLGLSDGAARGLLGACHGGEDPYVFQGEPLDTVCHHHESALPAHTDAVYDTLHLSLRLPSKDHQAFEPILSQRFVTRERSAIEGFGGHDALGAEGTVAREWEWLPRKALEEKGLSLRMPEDGCPLLLRQETRTMNSILFGIESSAPLKKDFFGHKHGVDAVSKSVSAFGKRKWRDYRACGQEVPANLGGMHVHVDAAKLCILREAIHFAPLCKPSDGPDAHSLKDELELFRQLLQSSDREVGEVLQRHLGVNRDQRVRFEDFAGSDSAALCL